MLRVIKNRVRALVPPVLFLGITWYFGTRGLEAQRVQEGELVTARQGFSTIDAQRSIWETKIATLNGGAIAGDMLDNEARIVLNLANPTDLIIQLPALSPPNKQANFN